MGKPVNAQILWLKRVSEKVKRVVAPNRGRTPKADVRSAFLFSPVPASLRHGVLGLSFSMLIHRLIIPLDVVVQNWQNGLKLTEKIKKLYPEITIIILTNYDLPEYREAGVRFKANHFFSKDSMTHQEVNALVKSILSEKRFKGNGSERDRS